jgi:hypothetical protein
MLQSNCEIALNDAAPKEVARTDYGQFDIEACREIMREVITTVILPGFESFGLPIDESREWINSI